MIAKLDLSPELLNIQITEKKTTIKKTIANRRWFLYFFG